MHTTNTGSADNPLTYSALEKDCEQLAAIARTIAALASKRDSVRDDPDFAEQTAEFHAKLQGIVSLANILERPS